MKTFKQLVSEYERLVNEIMPWDLEQKLCSDHQPLVLDIREPEEFAAMHVAGSVNVPRGILEAACDYGYSETMPVLAEARAKEVVVVCRSGNRSVLAAYTMQLMGYENVISLKTGLKGWNDYEQPLVDQDGEKVEQDRAEVFLSPKVEAEQLQVLQPEEEG
ncbi:MAG: rhodanese-like domain-containing protein [Gammaproteobacteria bacterium]|nr:rhodanese-like domain-containing protein [Gammaproteobacteria bacterium]